MLFSTTVDIDASTARVWAVMIDVERWHEWTPSVTRIERVDAGPLAVGSRLRIHQPKLRPALWRMTHFDEGRESTWVAHGPGVIVTARHWVEPRDGGSRATLSVRFSGPLGPLVGRITKGLNNRYLALEAAGLKRRSELQDRD